MRNGKNYRKGDWKRMNIKRFTLTNPKNTFQEMKCGIDDKGNTLTFNEVVDLLNHLHEENQQLKKELGLLAEFNQKAML